MRGIFSLCAAVLMAGLFSATVSAATVTIDFEDAPEEFASGDGFNGTYETQGFSLVSTRCCWATIGTAPQIPDKAMMIGAWGFGFDLYGDDFSLSSFDIGFLNGSGGTINLRGYRDGGQILSEVINASAGYTLPSYQTILLGASWENLDRIRFDITPDSCCPGSASALDNIVLTTATAVPVPAAVWLFGSALAGLGWLRRKSSA